MNMLPESTETMNAVDRVSDQKSVDCQGDLNRSVWEEVKQGFPGKREPKAHELDDQATLEFSLEGLYASVHDGLSLGVSESRTVANADFSAGEGAIAVHGRPVSSDGSEKDSNQVITRSRVESSENHVDRLGDRPVFKPGELEGERKRLNELAEGRITSPAELAQFKKDMEALEARADKQGLNHDEVARTFSEITSILEATGECPLTAQDRVAVAEQVMHQAAAPPSIDQGKHVTCNTATIESRTYTLNPAAAAHLVAEVAINGLYETSRRRVIHPSAESLKPDQEAQHNPPLEGKRSHASQIFQVTAINIYQSEVSGDQIRYEQRSWGPKPGDSGERLVDVSSEPHKELQSWNEQKKAWEPIQTPRVPLEAIPLISEQITGKFEKEMLIVPEQNGDNQNWTKVNSAQELEAKLRELKQGGKLPVVLPVWANNEPFLSDSGGGDPRGQEGQHVITITDYEERTGKIRIDNQFGHGSDRSFTAKELYSCTESAFSDANVQALKEEVERNRGLGKIDTAKELDWVRVQAGKGLIKGDFYYDEALIAVRRDAEKRWQQQKENGTYDPKDEKSARAKLYSVSKDFQPLRQFRVQGRSGGPSMH